MVGRILAAALLVLSASPAQAAEVSVLSSTALTTDPVGELVVSGEGELGVQPIPELKAVPGVEIVGPLPGDLSRLSPCSPPASAPTARILPLPAPSSSS